MLRILVTGSSGFVGTNLINRLNKAKDLIVLPSNSKNMNLLKPDEIGYCLSTFKPDIIIHLAAKVGGIQANAAHPGLFIHDNLAMGINLIEAARLHKVRNFIMLGTVCSYPKFTPVPFKESDFWNGYPEETNAPYGIAKKALVEMLGAYRNQYGMNSICLIPSNMYGPYDHFNEEVSHVIPALIKKIIEAKNFGYPNIKVWGDGTASREFLYVDDCVESIIRSLHFAGHTIVNIGTGIEVTIRELAYKICHLVGYVGNIEWETDKPNGQPRRCLDVSKAKECLDFEAKIDLETGLKRTIEWYKGKIGG